jgi:hypothetical protein
MSTGNQAYLDNTMLGETVIYCDDKSVKHPAMILNPVSDEIVDLIVYNRNTEQLPIDALVKAVPFNHKIEAVPGTWWRRNKF